MGICLESVAFFNYGHCHVADIMGASWCPGKFECMPTACVRLVLSFRSSRHTLNSWISLIFCACDHGNRKLPQTNICINHYRCKYTLHQLKLSISIGFFVPLPSPVVCESFVTVAPRSSQICRLLPSSLFDAWSSVCRNSYSWSDSGELHSKAIRVSQLPGLPTCRQNQFSAYIRSTL